MKIYPWHLNNIPYNLYAGTVWGGEENAKITEEKLRAILKINKHDQEIECDRNIVPPKTKRDYLATCEILGIHPQIRVAWEGVKDKLTPSTPREIAEKMKQYRKRYEEFGYQPAEIERKLKQAKRVENNTRKNAIEQEGKKDSYSIGAKNFEKMQNSEQAHVYNIVANINYGLRAGEEGSFKITSKNTREKGEALNKIYRGARGDFRVKVINRIKKLKEFYLDELEGKIRDRETQPPRTIHIVRSVDASITDRYENCFIDEGATRYGKYKPKKTPVALEGQELYIDTRGALAASEEVIFSAKDEAWTEAPPGERWLCTNPRPTPGLLGYHQQPRDTENAEKYRFRRHRIGFEVEFDTPYNKGSCIRNREGRPLTPVKVLDDFGWALCPDSSVGGGELKSPIIYFKTAENTEQILDQIPEEIQEFINMVNKGEACGGHLNYSTNTMMAMNAMSVIMSWGFVFPLMYPERVNGKANKNGRNYRTFNQIADPGYKYQWLRLKPRCVEVRVFPAHWDIKNICWRSRLLALMVEDALEKAKKAKEETSSPLVLATTPYYDLEMVMKEAEGNWEQFRKNKHNPIREHVIASVGLNQLKRELDNHAEMIHAALGIPTTKLTTIE